MQFTSMPFFVFLFLVVLVYYALPHRYRNYLLLTASYYFYFSIQPEYLVLLIGSTLANYFLGRGLEIYRNRRKMLLSAGLLINLGILFFFKYFNFFGEQVNAVFSSISLNLSVPQHSLILPVGISFYTFMALGYILDVYWGDIKSQRNIFTFSVYLAFFPQILCGPIGRAKNLFKQFTDEHPLQYDNFANGFRLILWGLFKKMVVADNIAVYVDAVFNNIPMHSSPTIIVATLLFPMQLYADFSGYTDIARGVARLFGYDLMVNFRTPYVNSTSVTEYWKRNHISLTSWFRDYVFYPFLGTSSSKFKLYLGILIMFVASGIWHGAGGMFIVWGGLQAFFLICEDITGYAHKPKGPILKVLTRISTYLVISGTLIFFRVSSSEQVREYFELLSNFNGHLFTGTIGAFSSILFGVLLLLLAELVLGKKQFDEWIATQKTLTRWSIYEIAAILILIIGNINGTSFIYFQF